MSASVETPAWHRHYPPTARNLAVPEPRALAGLLDDAAHDFADRPCLTLEDWTLSYGEVAALVSR